MSEPPAEWVLPLVVRIERHEPPSRTDALVASAQAVLRMLTSDEPEWRERVEAWEGSRIRKVVRRARGADWRRAAQLPGITVGHGSAEVRVYPPVPLDGWPPDLARLQVGGTDLDDPTPAPAPAPTPGAGEPLVLLSPQVAMTAGKAMAQAGHAAQLGWRAMTDEQRNHWRTRGFPLAVLTATPETWAHLVDAGVPVVHDAGFTEVEPGSATALFAGGAYSSVS